LKVSKATFAAIEAALKPLASRELYDLDQAAFAIGKLVGLGDFPRAFAEARLQVCAGVHGYNTKYEPSDISEAITDGLDAGEKYGRHKPAGDQADAEDDTIDANTLLGMTFDPIKFVIPGYVVEGLTILAGAPKLGKSWLAYDYCIAVATGGRAMGKVQCEQGNVLYLALEDNRRRVADRIKTLCPLAKQRRIDLSRLQVRTRAPRIDTGLLAELDKWRTSVEHPRLIIIDVWLKVRPPRKSGADPYAADYDNAQPLQRYASEHGLAIIIVTHTRKMAAEDRLETVNGTNGITGVADSVLVLSRDAGMTLYGRGRDIEEVDTAMKFDAGQWLILGDATEVSRSHERRKILEALADAGKPMGPKEIAEQAGLNVVNVRAMLIRMVKAGDAVRAGYGLYESPHHTHHTHHNDNEKPENANKTAPKRKRAV
jgi:hypothetical protein